VRLVSKEVTEMLLPLVAFRAIATDMLTRRKDIAILRLENAFVSTIPKETTVKFVKRNITVNLETPVSAT
jgi:hypothetical protein